MSEILPGVHVVEGVSAPGRSDTVNVCLLVAGDGTATLIDAGFPGIADRLKTTLAAARLSPGAVRRVIVTHHHPDHTSGLPEVIAMTGAEVWAHAADADIIDGTRPRERPVGLTAGVAALQASPVPVTLRLVGGETLGALGGCHLIHTPGHTPGHTSLYLPALSLLIAADIVRYVGGMITRAPEAYTADHVAAEKSLRSLAELDFERLLPYHGEFLGVGAGTQLRRDLRLT